MWEEDLEDKTRRKIRWLIGIGAAVLVVVAGAYWYASQHRAEPVPAAAVAPPATLSATPQIQHPLPEAESGVALPALNDSDQVAHDSLAGVLGQDAVEQFLVPQNIVRHIVVTVDNLPRHRVAVDLRPVKPTAGQPATAAQGEITTLSEANFARYTPLVRVVQGADVKGLALVYRRMYPLFQQAYEDLGYPGKYFNDRVVETIDNLLESPEITTPVQVVQPRVMWEYADAGLESRSAGQKLLIRMGPANARIIKAKLREFRAEITKKP
jgi:Protein of unknown function (DUF3014)